MALTTLTLQQIWNSQSNKALLALFEINHADWPSPFRIVNNPVSIVSNGDTYDPFPVNCIFADQDPESPQPTAQLTIDVVDRTILNTLRGVTSGITVTITLVIEGDLDTPMLIPWVYRLTNINYDRMSMNGTLTLKPFLARAYPYNTFDQESFPALWSQ